MFLNSWNDVVQNAHPLLLVFKSLFIFSPLYLPLTRKKLTLLTWECLSKQSKLLSRPNRKLRSKNICNILTITECHIFDNILLSECGSVTPWMFSISGIETQSKTLLLLHKKFVVKTKCALLNNYMQQSYWRTMNLGCSDIKEGMKRCYDFGSQSI